MKKKIGVLLSVFCLAFTLLFTGVNRVDAAYWKGEPEDYPNAALLGMDSTYSFNVLKGYSTNQSFMNSSFFRNVTLGLIGYMYNGTFLVEGYFNNNSAYKARVEIEFTDDEIDYIEVYAFDELIYQVYGTDTSEYKVMQCKEMNIKDYIPGVETVTFTVNRIKMPYEYDSDYEQKYVNLIGLSCIKCMRYSYNEKYKGQDVHFYTDIRQPLTEAQIKESVSSYDFTDGSATLDIINSNYNPSAYGDYTFDIRAVDKGGNVTIQKCYITVTYIQKPSLSAKSDLTASYTDKKSPESFFNFDSSMHYSFNADNYSPNWSTPGSYYIEIHVYDDFGNYSDCGATISVGDFVPPVITYKNRMVTTESPLTEEDLKGIAEAYDTVKGKVSVTYVDVDNYLSNTKKPGTYRIGVSASDGTNVASAEVTILVVDNDSPTITVGKYTIVVPEGTPISRDEIVACVKQSGVSELSDVISDYFDVDGASGSYDATLVANGVDSATIEAGYADYITYNPTSPTKSDKKSYTNVIIFGVLALSMTGVIVVMGRIVSKKKH